MILEITEALLEEQIPSSPTKCAIALAIMRECPDLQAWAFYQSLSIFTADMATAKVDEHIRITNDKAIQEWMSLNDQFEINLNVKTPASPIQIEIDIEAGQSRLLRYNYPVKNISVEEFYACSNCDRVPPYRDAHYPMEGQRLIRSNPFTACAYCLNWIFNPWSSEMLHPLDIFTAQVNKVWTDHHRKGSEIQNTRTHYKVTGDE